MHALALLFASIWNRQATAVLMRSNIKCVVQPGNDMPLALRVLLNVLCSLSMTCYYMERDPEGICID